MAASAASWPLRLDDVGLRVDNRLGLCGVKQVYVACVKAGSQLTGPFPVPADGHCLVRFRPGSRLRTDIALRREREAAVGVNEGCVVAWVIIGIAGQDVEHDARELPLSRRNVPAGVFSQLRAALRPSERVRAFPVAGQV
jgi:hypothetical protein